MMRPEHIARLRALPDDVRCRVLERACILHEATGCTWEDADQRAFELEAKRQRELFR